ncbi:MAG: hypothetical protein GY854_20555 [Deltaproteobacteria bacterium]|nr:hypothetical protein [Deltaproteobacteria bacterium]
MTFRLRFILFFFAGVAVPLVPLGIFLLTGILEADKDFTYSDLAIGFGVSFVALVAIIVSMLAVLRLFDRTVTELVEGIEQISNGNLSPSWPKNVPAEIGVIQSALQTMCGQMRMVLSQLNSLSEHVVDSTSGAGDSFIEVQKGADMQSDIASRTFKAIEELRTGLLAASRGVESLVKRIDRNASQVSQMDVAIVHVSEMTGGLNENIEQASDSTREGNRNSRRLAKDVSELATSIATAQNALDEMMEGARQARSEAGDSAHIMGNLQAETERIGAAIEDVIRGSDEAHRSNERILDVTANLQSRVDRVDGVIEVIRNLAERTKLLSINASIIASEAGEHGRAFAVVANEIKDLAGSTAGAIQEISKVIVGLKEGFDQTIETIQRGQEDVEEGVQLARNAVELLGSIPEKVHKAAEYNSGIVGRTERQVTKGSQIQEIIGKVDSTLEQVTSLLIEQVSQNERTLTLFQNINSTAEHVLLTTQDHAKTSGEVARNVEIISEDFRSLAEQVREHMDSLDNVVNLSEDVLSITDSNRRRARELSQLIGDLNRFALYLGDDFRKLGEEKNGNLKERLSVDSLLGDSS